MSGRPRNQNARSKLPKGSELLCQPYWLRARAKYTRTRLVAKQSVQVDESIVPLTPRFSCKQPKETVNTLPVTLTCWSSMWTFLLSSLSTTVTSDLNMRQNDVAAEWTEKPRIRWYLRRRADQ